MILLMLLKGGRATGFCAAILLLIAASSSAFAQTGTSSHIGTPRKKVITGKASFYGGSDGLDGQTTANGDTFDHHEHTAASRVIPLGSKARVTNLKNGESTTVTITDRGPLARGRKIDLSKDAARDIGLTKKEGVTPVKIVVTKPAAVP
jgi:rare lipoprotein A